jgi:hypothetical protein
MSGCKTGLKRSGASTLPGKHMCISLSQGKVIVAGGKGLYGVVLTDVELNY